MKKTKQIKISPENHKKLKFLALKNEVTIDGALTILLSKVNGK